MLKDTTAVTNDPHGPDGEVTLVMTRLREVAELAPGTTGRMRNDRSRKIERTSVTQDVEDIDAGDGAIRRRIAAEERRYDGVHAATSLTTTGEAGMLVKMTEPHS